MSQTSVNKVSKINNGAVTGEKDSFISTLSSKVETDSTIEEATAVSTKDMTLEEYKNYIYDKISEFSLHPDLMRDAIMTGLLSHILILFLEDKTVKALE